MNFTATTTTTSGCCTVMLLLTLPGVVFTGLIIITSKPKHASTRSPATGPSHAGAGEHAAETSNTTSSDTRRENGLPSSRPSHDKDLEYLFLDATECIEETSWMPKILQQERLEVFYASTGATQSGSATTTSSSSSSLDGRGHCLLYFTVPRGMVVEMTVLELWPTDPVAACKRIYFDMYEIRNYVVRSLSACSSEYLKQQGVGTSGDTEAAAALFPVARSDTNSVRVQIMRDTLELPFTLRFRLSAVDAALSDARLRVQYVTPSEGFVETPHLPSLGPDPTDTSSQRPHPADTSSPKPYPAGMSSKVEIRVPPGHSVMVTFLHLDIDGRSDLCELDGVCLHLDSAKPRRLLGCYCEDVHDGPWLVRTDVLYVHFVSYLPQGNHTGFQLYFSFHRQSALLGKVNGDQWNCSVPHWPDFKRHFPCNLQMDCVEGEDEADCPYMSPFCPRGYFFSAGGGCFRYFDPKSALTWNEAAEACAESGPSSYLAALNTPGEWFGVLRLLLLRKRVAEVEMVYIGLRYSEDVLPRMYQYNLHWMDSTIAFYLHLEQRTWATALPSCGYLSNPKDGHYSVYRFTEDTTGETLINTRRCDREARAAFLCETDRVEEDGAATAAATNTTTSLDVELAKVSDLVFAGIVHVVCRLRHVAHQFLACDSSAACWDSSSDVTSCAAPLTPLPPMFACTSNLQRVSYTLVCDYRRDCIDGSDEDFCVHAPCPFDWLHCGNGQCVEFSKRCDDVSDCQNNRDELLCATVTSRRLLSQTVPPPAAAIFLSTKDLHFGIAFFAQPLNTSALTATAPGFACPDTHFPCPGGGYYCLPVFLRCNDVRDCPGGEDEAGCESFRCPGFYRCRGSKMCLHAQYVCDGMQHCPQLDDELFCALACPRRCTCYGLAYICTGAAARASVREVDSVHVRFLDASGTGVTAEDVANSTMLVYLSLAGCFLSELKDMRFANVRSLDLHDNLLTDVKESHFASMLNLRELSLAGNPLAVIQGGTFWRTFRMIQKLDLSSTVMSSVGSLFAIDSFLGLEVLNLSYTGITSVSGKGFQSLTRLRTLDLRGCPMVEFTRDMFHDLHFLDRIYTDNYKLCCPAMLPEGFNPKNCHSPSDEISSCDALLRSVVYRVFLFLFSSMSTLGNLSSFVYREVSLRRSKNKAFNLFVTHLCVADFLMGVYLLIIGVADQLYRGAYLWKDAEWRHGSACRAAGFLSLLSSEVSAFIICLITLDRFLVLRFPLSWCRFGVTSGQVTMLVTWCVGLTLAAVPLLPVTSHWEFYSQTAICIPLPVTRKQFPGYGYSFGVMVATNFVLFLVIAMGQLSIYCAVRANSVAGSDSSSPRSKDLTIAARLITVAMSDFLCWFPIGLLGILTARGVAIPGEVNVAVAIFVLPFNSALNPFLYTLNMIRERRQQAKEQRLRLFLLAQAKQAEKMLR